MADRAVDETSVLAEELKNLLTSNIEGNLQLLTRVSNMVREASRSQGINPALPQQPSDVITRLVRLNFAYFSALTKHGLAFADELTAVTERALGISPRSAARPAPAPTPSAAAPARLEIKVNAQLGSTAAAAFFVENENPQPEVLNVSFEAIDIVSADGSFIPSPRVSFEPSRLSLKPHLQETVKVLVDITPEFRPGQVYVARIKLVGLEPREVWIFINVLPASEKASAPVDAETKVSPSPPQAGVKRTYTKRKRTKK
jgi:hypothetical protein